MSDFKCPTCESPQPSMHPAAGEGGEVTSICPDPFHGKPDPPDAGLSAHIQSIVDSQGCSPKAAEAILLGGATDRMLKELAQKYGAEFSGFGEERHELFVRQLVEWGIVSPAQMEDFEVFWARHAFTKVSKMMEEVQRAANEAQAAERRRLLTQGVTASAVSLHSGGPTRRERRARGGT